MKNVFVHEKALCDSQNVGEGTRIWGFSHVLAEAKIGKHCNIGEQVFIENRVSVGNYCTIKNGVSLWDLVTLEDGVFIGPNAAFTNDLRPRAFIRRDINHFLPTLVKKGATIGANATLVCGITVGEFAMVGAGAVVTQDVPPHTLVVGSPARSLGRICYCAEKLTDKDYCSLCKKNLTENSAERAAKAITGEFPSDLTL